LRQLGRARVGQSRVGSLVAAVDARRRYQFGRCGDTVRQDRCLIT
jgi:hypothetical protein